MANTHEVLDNVKAYTLELLGTQFRDAAEDAANRSESGATRSESAAARSESARDAAESTVADALNNAATSVRDEVKSDADRAEQAATNAATSESSAKASETSAGDYAAVATTAATEAVDAMERATDLAGGDFATREYVDQKVSSVTLTGTGTPEGKVAAPVGSVYTDSAATNGAIRWIKTSGTSNTGWRVEYGDTGRRVIHDADTPPTRGTGTVRLHRVGSMVTMSVFAYTLPAGYTISETLFTIPSGFAPEYDIFSYPVINRNAIQERQTIDIRSWGDVSVVGNPTGRLYWHLSWHTSNPWPASLPGNPA